MGWKDIFGPYGAGSSGPDRPDYNAGGYAGGPDPFAARSYTGGPNTDIVNTIANQNVATATSIAAMQAQMNAVYAAATQAGTQAASRPRYGHSDEQLKTLKGSTEYFYIEQRTTMASRQIMPLYEIKSFRLGYGATRKTDPHSVVQVQVPAEMYESRAEAEVGVAEKLREFLTSMVDQLSAEMTQASLGSGLLGDPELDLTDALRKYLAAVKS